jgi:hypothetical protein
MKSGGNLREENPPYEVIRYLPEGTNVEIRDSSKTNTKFSTAFLGLGPEDHSWAYHIPSGSAFRRSDRPRSGWIVDSNLSLVAAPKEEAAEERAQSSGTVGVTFAAQVRLLQSLAQYLVKPPAQLMVHQYQGAAVAWLQFSNQALANIVGQVDQQHLFAAGIVNKLVTAQTSPGKSPIIHKMVEDVMGNQMAILGDASANMSVTDWEAKIRNTNAFQCDFPSYFKDVTEIPAEERPMTGRRLFFDENAY